MAYQDLVLDRDVRNWVLLPLTLSIVLMKLLQQYAVKLMAAPRPKEAPKPEKAAQQSAVARSALLRTNHSFITDLGFRQRRAHFTGKDGIFLEKLPAKKMEDMLNANPDFMQGMLKQQLGGLVPQMGMGALVNYFFSGFILGRVPLALSPKFRAMLQRGIDLPALDPSYFTSLSFYILALFGLGGIFRLVFAEDALNDAAMMAQMQPGMGGAAAPAPMFDAQKAFESEQQALDLIGHTWRFAQSEERAAAVLREGR